MEQRERSNRGKGWECYLLFSASQDQNTDRNSNLLEERFNLAHGFLGFLVHHGGEGRVQGLCPWRWEGEAIPIHLPWTRKDVQEGGSGHTFKDFPLESYFGQPDPTLKGSKVFKIVLHAEPVMDTSDLNRKEGCWLEEG